MVIKIEPVMMDPGTSKMLGELLGATNSELIRFFGLLVIALVVVIPIYRLVTKHRLERIKHESELELERKKHEIELEQKRAERESARVNDVLIVVKSNTEALIKLNSLLDMLTSRNDEGHLRIHSRLDDVLSCLQRDQVQKRVKRGL